MSAPPKPLSYGRQTISQEDIDAVVGCLRGDWLTQGPTVAAFESALCERTGARYAVAVNNGTAALHLAVLALGIGPGQVGVTSAITFLASANCLRYTGADARFADVDPRTGLVDLDSLATRCAELDAEGCTPKVILPVDFAGQPAGPAQVRRLADRYGATILEDAAHALGATYEVDGTTYTTGGCAHAELAIFSFHPVKHIATGEGGAILTNDKHLYKRLLQLRNHGMHRDDERLLRPDTDPFRGPWYYEMDQLGHNYRITDIQCALGLSQLERLDDFLERRRAIARRYDEALSVSPLAESVRPLLQLPDQNNAYHLYVVQLMARPGEDAATVAQRRKGLFLHLREQGIFCQVHYVPVPWQPYYRQHDEQNTSVEDVYPGARDYYAASLSLPCYPTLTDADIDRVVAALATGLAVR